MSAVCGNGIRLRDIGHDHIGRVTDQDIPGWETWIPLKWSLQVVHLFLQGHDAFDLAMGALSTRVSPPALGVLRFMAEAYVAVRWLTDSADVDERQRRAAAQTTYTLQVIAKGTKDDPAVTQNVVEQVPKIRGAIGLTDDIELPKRPTTKDLFDQYLSGDLWPILSQMGSHPGFQQIYLFFVEDPAAAG
jgi:hypothetical protein